MNTGTHARIDDVMISALSKSLHLGIGIISTQATSTVSPSFDQSDRQASVTIGRRYFLPSSTVACRDIPWLLMGNLSSSGQYVLLDRGVSAQK
jgi:hypothetical protein